jgi:hypothetical protein
LSQIKVNLMMSSAPQDLSKSFIDEHGSEAGRSSTAAQSTKSHQGISPSNTGPQTQDPIHSLLLGQLSGGSEAAETISKPEAPFSFGMGSLAQGRASAGSASRIGASPSFLETFIQKTAKARKPAPVVVDNNRVQFLRQSMREEL